MHYLINALNCDGFERDGLSVGQSKPKGEVWIFVFVQGAKMVAATGPVTREFAGGIVVAKKNVCHSLPFGARQPRRDERAARVQ